MRKMSLSDLKNLFSIVNSNQIVNIRDTKHAASKKNFAHPNKGLSKGERNHNQFILNKKKADYRYEMNLEQFENGLTENQPE